MPHGIDLSLPRISAVDNTGYTKRATGKINTTATRQVFTAAEALDLGIDLSSIGIDDWQDWQVGITPDATQESGYKIDFTDAEGNILDETSLSQMAAPDYSEPVSEFVQLAGQISQDGKQPYSSFTAESLVRLIDTGGYSANDLSPILEDVANRYGVSVDELKSYIGSQGVTQYTENFKIKGDMAAKKSVLDSPYATPEQRVAVLGSEEQWKGYMSEVLPSVASFDELRELAIEEPDAIAQWANEHRNDEQAKELLWAALPELNKEEIDDIFGAVTSVNTQNRINAKLQERPDVFSPQEANIQWVADNFDEFMSRIEDTAKEGVDPWAASLLSDITGAQPYEVVDYLEQYKADKRGFFTKLMDTWGQGSSELFKSVGGGISWLTNLAGDEDKAWIKVGKTISDIGENASEYYGKPGEGIGWGLVQMLPAFAVLAATTYYGGFIVGSIAEGTGVTAATAGALSRIPLIGSRAALYTSSIIEATTVGTASRSIESLMEAGGTYHELVKSGMSEEEASDIAEKIFTRNLQLAGTDILQFAVSFSKIGDGIEGLFAKNLVTKIGGKGLKIGTVALSEAGEEYYQEIIQRQALGEDISTLDIGNLSDEEIQAVVILGAITGGLFEGAGELARINKTTLGNISPDLAQQVRTRAAEIIRTNTELSEDEALTQSFNELAQSNPEIADVGARSAQYESIQSQASLMMPISKVNTSELTSKLNSDVAALNLQGVQPIVIEGFSPRAQVSAETTMQLGEKQPWQMTREEFRRDIGEYNAERLERINVDIEGRLSTLDRQGTEWKTYQRDNPQLKEDPQTVVIYRATEGKGFNSGDWVYLRRDMAKMHQENRPGSKIISREVSISDIIPGQDSTEFIYSPTKSNELTHREIVKQALSEGKPVPAEVIADYPDLQQRYGKAEGQAIQPETPAEPAPAVKTTFKESTSKITDIKNRYKQKIETMQNIKKELVNYIRENLPVSEQGKLITQVRDAKTNNNLDKAITRVDEVKEKYWRKALKADIAKQLKNFKVSKTTDVTADVNKAMAEIKDSMIEGDYSAAMEAIADNQTAYENGEITFDELQARNYKHYLTGYKSMDSSQLQYALDEIKSLKESGRSLIKERLAEEESRIENMVVESVDTITGGKGLKLGYESQQESEYAKERGVVSGFLDKLTNWTNGLREVSYKLSSLDTRSKQGDSYIDKTLVDRNDAAKDAQDLGKEKYIDELRGLVADVYGVEYKTNKQRNKAIGAILNKLGSDEVTLGPFKNASGDMVSITFTREQLVQIWMLAQDPTLEQSFWQGLRWTPEMITAIGETLTTEEINLGQSLLNFYQGYYDSINKVYSKLHGVDLPKNPYYSPVKRILTSQPEAKSAEAADEMEHTLFFQDAFSFASVENKSLKSRVPNTHKLVFDGAISTALNHVVQMEHYKAYADFIHDYNRVFRNPRTRDAIIQYHGRDILRHLNGVMEQITRDSLDTTKTIAILDKARRNVTYSMLGANFLVGVKQSPLVTSLGYMMDMPVMDFFRYTTEFCKHPRKNGEFIYNNSIFLRSRWQGEIERDVAYSMSQDASSKLGNSKNILQKLLILIRLNDLATNSMGMWAKYKSELKMMGVTGEPTPEQHETAIRRAERTTRIVQEGSEIGSLSPMQRSGSIGKLFTMFQDQPNKYFRITSTTLMDLKTGRIDKGLAFKRLMLANVILPAIFYLASKPWHPDKDKEELLINVSLAGINNIMVFGTMAQGLEDVFMGKPWADDFSQTPVSEILASGGDAIKGFMKLTDGIDDGEIESFIEDLLMTAGYATGVPVRGAYRVKGAIESGDIRRLAWSEYALDPDGKEKREVKDKQNKLHSEWNNLLGKEKPLADTKYEDILGIASGREIYDMGDYYSNFISRFGQVEADSITEANGFSPQDVAAMETREILLTISRDYSSQTLVNYDPDTANYSLEEYKRLYDYRKTITDDDDLTEFDELYGDVSLGNIDNDVYNALVSYLDTPKDKQDDYLDNLKEKSPALYDKLTMSPKEYYIKTNPDVNAKLALWGKHKIMTRKAYTAYKNLMSQYNIPADAEVNGMAPPENLSDDYFDYQDLSSEFSASSSETLLYRMEHPELTEWMGLSMPDNNIEILRINVDYRAQDKDYDAFNTDDVTTSQLQKLREAYLLENPDYAQARIYRNGYSAGVPDEWIDTYVEYINSDLTGNRRLMWLRRNMDFYEAVRELFGWAPLRGSGRTITGVYGLP